MAITKELLDQIKVSQAITPTDGAAGSTDIDGAACDMANFEGVLIELTFGAITTGAVTGIQVQQSDTSNFAVAENVGAAIVVADDDDGQTFVVNVHKPSKRYVRVHVDRATQNAVVAAALYMQYGGRTIPTSAHGSLVNAVSLVTPAAA